MYSGVASSSSSKRASLNVVNWRNSPARRDRTHENLSYMCRIFDQYSGCAPGLIDTEIEYMHIPWCKRWRLFACSFSINGIYTRRSSLGCQYIERLTVRRPYRCGHHLLVGHIAVGPVRTTALKFACQAVWLSLWCQCVDGEQFAMVARTKLGFR